ncbi:phage tail protein [Lactiplantibacillus plantarum]|uniref:beta strand repeat-containing protein n=1 Tax=Lactiplantibacillus plantarum TaxID=1590 RepID=UPI0021AA69DE|nr:phage tail protein [Lactiplantibacillus plantarum]MDN6015791.1 phage tail protein [Lactiplantibacillus plantarum]MDP4437713.1 phage tail protein [Lactiplantibacillus plantarum]MDP4440837.1 phage tail protein [Lactiplantibacillus plantarum]MDP4459434.1 phage tail protein [Lactiplantibacillus plantarum]
MAESNATQVILTDDGIKIIKAQNTADNAAGGVANLNDPNLMSVIEKQTEASQYAGLTSQYNVILKRAKDASISTAALTTAYTNLNSFMAAILTDTTKASDVNRDTYKSLTDAYNTALSNVQTALSNSFNTDIDNMQSSVSVASQAASSAAIVASQAAITGDNASQVASKALTAASQAQIAGNNATSVANNASQAASSAVLAGSQATVSADKAIGAANEAKSAGDNAISVANNASQAASSAILAGSTAAVSASQASADYQTLSAGVKDGSVVHITTETVIDKGVIGTAEIANAAITNAKIGKLAVGTAQIADLAVGTAQIGDAAITNAKIGSLAVGTAQIANGAITNAQIGSLAVDTANIKDAAINSAKIASLAVGTAQIGDGAITNAKIGKLAVGTAQIKDAAITDAKVGSLSANKLTAGTIDFNTINGKNINASNITTGTMSTDRLNVGKLSALSANLGNVTTGSLKGVDIVANSFSTPNGSFTTDANGAVVASNLTIRGVTNLVYNAALLGGNWNVIPGWSISNNGYCALNITHDGVPSIGFSNTAGAGVWNIFAQTKLYPLNGVTGQPFSASVWFLELGSDTSLQYSFTLAFFDSNGNRIESALFGQTWNGVGSKQDWRYVTVNNAVAPSNAVSVGLQYWSYNGKGNAFFSSPMLTQTSQSTGYQPDTGNVVSAGIINGSVINGSTINGTTFHGGDIINNANNTARYYPMTITPDGAYKSTYFDSAVGLQSSVESGAINYKYRSMVGNNGQYLAYDSVINGQGFESHSGYTSTKDVIFSNTETITGYVNVTPDSGIYLYGPTQKINFAGNADNIGSNGVTMDAYGNIYAQANSAYWRIRDINGHEVANFGIDTANQRDISLYRDTQVGNLFLGVGHTIGMLDSSPLYFKKGDSNGRMLGLYAGAIHYENLIKSSLLSVKQDVKKADTAYWAQLVNSIDLATYQYKTDDNTSHIRLSSIVDDVNDTKQWQLPDVFVSRDEDGKLCGVDDSVLLNATLATVQEQQKEIDQLNGHNMELEARLNKLEAKLNG